MSEGVDEGTSHWAIVDDDGSIAIPGEFLRDCGWTAGDDLAIDVVGGVIKIRKIDS